MSELDALRMEIRDATESLFRHAYRGVWDKVAQLADRLAELEKRQAELQAQDEIERPFDG